MKNLEIHSCGESQTIETDSGKVVDLLCTADGVEIYVDGELLDMDMNMNMDMDMNFNAEGLHEKHSMRKPMEIVCDDSDTCDENIFIMIKKEVLTED